MPSVGGVLRELHIPWPAANDGSLREASATWANLAAVIRDNHETANRVAASLTSTNHGQAIDAFEKYWSTSYGSRNGLLPRGADACEAMAKATSRYADAVSEAKTKIGEAGAEVAATLVIGAVGAFFTFGAAEAAADWTAVWLTNAVEGIFAALGEITAGIVSDAFYAVAQALGTEVAEDIMASGLVGGAAGVGGTTLADTVQDDVRQLFSQAPLSDGEAAKDILAYGLAGGVISGSVAKVGELTASQLSALLSDGAAAIIRQDPPLATKMAELAKFLYGTTGKISAGVLATATSQLLTAQQIDAEGVVSDQLQDYLLRAAEGGT